MNKYLAILVMACAFGLVASPASAAEKGKKKKDGDDIFSKYDTNKNGVLDADEIVALREAFKKGDEELKKFDTNNDGTLDDNEVAAIKPAEKKKKKNK